MTELSKGSLRKTAILLRARQKELQAQLEKAKKTLPGINERMRELSVELAEKERERDWVKGEIVLMEISLHKTSQNLENAGPFLERL